jgi:hypothetical protein
MCWASATPPRGWTPSSARAGWSPPCRADRASSCGPPRARNRTVLVDEQTPALRRRRLRPHPDDPCAGRGGRRPGPAGGGGAGAGPGRPDHSGRGGARRPVGAVRGTPFGHGRPFTRRQLERLVRSAGLEPTAWSQTLYVPPWGPLLGWPTASSRSARPWLPGAAGVILLEATRQAYARASPRRGRGDRAGPGPPCIPQPASRSHSRA